MVTEPLEPTKPSSTGWMCVSWWKTIFHDSRLAASVPSSGSVASPEKLTTSPALNVEPLVGVRMRGTGGPPAVIVTGSETLSSVLSEVVRRAVYRPLLVYVCDGLGCVDVDPSPKFQR